MITWRDWLETERLRRSNHRRTRGRTPTRLSTEPIAKCEGCKPNTSGHLKSDKNAAGWLPAHDRCWFVARVLGVKRKYGLEDAAEQAALDRVLANCSNRVDDRRSRYPFVAAAVRRYVDRPMLLFAWIPLLAHVLPHPMRGDALPFVRRVAATARTFRPRPLHDSNACEHLDTSFTLSLPAHVPRRCHPR